MEAMPFALTKQQRVLLAFASVYLFWGSTYAAIHIAGEHLAAPLVSATRCLLSVICIAVICIARRKRLAVAPGELWRLALVGVLFMSANNVLLTWAEQMVPSGFASLVVSTMPIMIALIEAALPDGESLHGWGWAGTLLGTAGITVLVWPSLHHQGGPQFTRPLLGVLVLLGAALSFAIGSALSRRFRFTADSMVATGWQLAAACVVNYAVAFAAGDVRHAQWSLNGFLAITYLAVFGSLLGLVAFTYLLQNVPVTKVATYAFVNPVIAVLLGVVLFGEHLSRIEVLGMAIVISGVAMVVFSRVGRTPRPRPAADAPPQEVALPS